MAINIEEMILNSTRPTSDDAVKALVDCGYARVGDDYQFSSDCSNPPNKTAIFLKHMELLNLWEAGRNKRNRRAALAQLSPEQQLDMIFNDKVNNTNHWVEWRQSILNQYPIVNE